MQAGILAVVLWLVMLMWVKTSLFVAFNVNGTNDEVTCKCGQCQGHRLRFYTSGFD